MFAHVDGGADDHRIVAIRFGDVGALDIHRVGLVAVTPDHVGNVLRDPRRQPLSGAVGDQNPNHDRSTSFWMVLSSCARQSASLTHATRFWSGCRVRCPLWAKATTATTTHSMAAHTRIWVNSATPVTRGVRKNMLAERLACMSIATSRFPVRS